MGFNKDGFLARQIKKNVEKEKLRYQKRPFVPFINENKQMWYFLMNQVDKEGSDGGSEDGSDGGSEDGGDGGSEDGGDGSSNNASGDNKNIES